MRFLPLVIFAIMSPETPCSGQRACGQNGVCECNPPLTKVNCSYRELSFVPLPLPQNIEQLSMKHNRLRRIPNNTFTSCHYLENIQLDNNEIREIEAGAFALNCSITTIQLSYNQLQNIPTEAISRCKSLKLLYLDNNLIHHIEDDAFLNNPSIRYLALQSNDLLSLPPFMYRPIKTADFVYLSTNKISEVLTSSFRDLRAVKCFALDENRITRLPEDLFRDILLTETLDLSDNLIEEIPEKLFFKYDGNYHYLTKLFLHKNKLRFLHRKTFEGLYKLKYVFLNSNQLQGLENGAFIGSSFKFIFLFGNNFTNIVNNSFDNENITEVHLFKNPIRNISTNALDGLKYNTALFISCISLKGLPRYNNDVNIVCVGSQYVPTITADKQYVKIMRKEGFNCTKRRPGKKGSFDCEPCRPGTFGDDKTGCLPCPPGGYYQDDVGQTAPVRGGMACKKCNKGTFVKFGQGISISNCHVCPEGTNQTTQAGYRACPCKIGYTRTDRFGECYYCFEEGLNCSLDYKFLLPGYYWNWSFPDANITEYKQFVSNLRNETRFFDPQTTGYTKYMPRVHLCPRPESCINNEGHMVNKVKGTCEKGYTGWLCSKCQNGYYAILDNCKPCPKKFWLYLEILLVLSLCCALYIFVRWQIKHDSKLGGHQRTLLDKISSRMKILLGFYQVVGELFESLHGLKWKYPFITLLGEFTSYAKLNVLRLFFRPQCLNKMLELDPLLRFNIRLCLPVIVVVSCFGLYYTRKTYVIYRFRGNLRVQKENLRSFKATLYTYALIFLFITYPPTCDAIFSLYPGACEKFYFDKSETYSIRLLRSDFDINCDNLAVYHKLAFVATALYVVAFPCVLLLLLMKYHRKVSKPVINRHPSSSDDDVIGSESDPLLSVEHAEHGAVPVWLKFLCENYKRQFWFWEIVELVRKIAQTTMVTLLGWENDVTILLTIGAAVLFLCLHARYLPMKSNFEQRLQLFSLTAIFINVMAKSMPTRQEGTVQMCVLLLNATIGLVVLAEALVGIISHIRRKWCCRNVLSWRS